MISGGEAQGGGLGDEFSSQITHHGNLFAVNIGNILYSASCRLLLSRSATGCSAMISVDPQWPLTGNFAGDADRLLVADRSRSM
jgi:hypothetical protein